MLALKHLLHPEARLYTVYRTLQMCMGMGKTAIPWVPWDSHGNVNAISHGMEMGMGGNWELLDVEKMGM